VQEIATRHPVLVSEMIEILKRLTGTTPPDDEIAIDDEVTENWDFSGDELVRVYTPLPVTLQPLNRESYQQRLTMYGTRLKHGESLEDIYNDLLEIITEAENYAERHEYFNALDLYALVIDERLNEGSDPLTAIFDKAIHETMPVLETLLSETSSNVVFNPSAYLSPLLPPEMRHRWLIRLFALWLKRINMHNTEENIPDIMLNVAWNEDAPLLRGLVQDEMQRHSDNRQANIVDFTHQHYVRILEKFFKELPRA
jgi:hypothetical protein